MKTLRSVAATLISAAIVVGLAPAAAAAPADDPTVTPQAECTPGWYYRSTSRGADSHAKVGSTQSNYNGSSSTATMTLTSTTSGTVSTTITGGTSIERES